MKESKLIVGLGNPGKNYEGTRHNLGFLTIDKLAENLKLKFKPCSFTKGLAAEDRTNQLFLLKPMSYVNASGEVVKAAAERYKTAPENILVICDDLNLNFAEIRIRPKGSTGGHNGLKSIAQYLGTSDFARLRLGIEHPGHKAKVVEYVLEEFDSRERKILEEFVSEAALCGLEWLNEGIKQTMNRYNRRKEK